MSIFIDSFIYKPFIAQVPTISVFFIKSLFFLVPVSHPNLKQSEGVRFPPSHNLRFDVTATQPKLGSCTRFTDQRHEHVHLGFIRCRYDQVMGWPDNFFFLSYKTLVWVKCWPIWEAFQVLANAWRFLLYFSQIPQVIEVGSKWIDGCVFALNHLDRV